MRNVGPSTRGQGTGGEQIRLAEGEKKAKEWRSARGRDVRRCEERERERERKRVRGEEKDDRFKMWKGRVGKLGVKYCVEYFERVQESSKTNGKVREICIV
eukprot:1327654-Amorphochlora_amoeboformis.AAC.1